MALLEVKGLGRSFGGLQAVNDVSFVVHAGAIKAVIGPNGAGKTTLFNLIAGSISPDRGEVFFDGTSIYGRQPYQIAGRGISRTFQHIRLFHGMSVLDNVALGRHTRSRAGFVAGMLKLPYTKKEEAQIREKAFEALRFLGMEELSDRDATSLAFGQQRAVEMSRALATEPRLLLLDEPAAGLNMHETAQTAELITRVRESGVTVLLVEHDMSLVMNISDEILVISSGRKIAEDVPLAIQKNREVIEIYLGEDEAA